jgi:hypothetical protein
MEWAKSEHAFARYISVGDLMLLSTQEITLLLNQKAERATTGGAKADDGDED